ncbi:hypothetical protein [Nonomuraea sp. NPDC003804]|uniref:hypothetical protein n=1 Tax=Nonomuraea sp. NPDC003804 TaxID=3154547 RepID=UPI0033BBA1B5
MPGGGGGPGWELGDELTAYLEAHQHGATWLVAVGSAGQASWLILRTGKPVIAMGGFTGTATRDCTGAPRDLRVSSRCPGDLGRRPRRGIG